MRCRQKLGATSDELKATMNQLERSRRAAEIIAFLGWFLQTGGLALWGWQVVGEVELEWQPLISHCGAHEL